MKDESKFGKNGWKIKVFYAVRIIAVALVVTIAALIAYNKIVPMYVKSQREKAERQKEEQQATELEDNNAKDSDVVDNDIEKNKDSAETTQVKENIPTTATLLAGKPDALLETHSAIPVIAASATSTISQEGTNNDPILLFDGRDDTTWQEGVSGYGVGESVNFSFDKVHQVKYLAFKLGNWKNDKYYYGNAKPKTMTLVLGDFSGQVTFTGDRTVEWVELSNKVTADSMRIIIDDVYPGTKWEDTCITEITIYGE